MFFTNFSFLLLSLFSVFCYRFPFEDVKSMIIFALSGIVFSFKNTIVGMPEAAVYNYISYSIKQTTVHLFLNFSK